MPLPAMYLGPGQPPEVGFEHVERTCEACGAPWVVLWTDRDGPMTGCRDFHGKPGHDAFVERVHRVGKPPVPADAPAWAREAPPERPQGVEAVQATAWLREWVSNGLENLPRVRRDLRADVDGDDGPSASMRLLRAVGNPIGGDPVQISADHIELGLRYLAGILEA